MTQYNLPVFASPTPGRTFLKDNMEPWRDAVHSMHAGVTRPDYVVPQMMWIDTSATPWVLKVFQGSNDIVLGSLDPVTLNFTPSAVDGSTVTGMTAGNVTATNTNGLTDTNAQGNLNQITETILGNYTKFGITSSGDMNTFLTSRIINGTVTNAPRTTPPATTAGFLRIEYITATFIFQHFTYASGSSETLDTWSRQTANGGTTWSEWIRTSFTIRLNPTGTRVGDVRNVSVSGAFTYVLPALPDGGQWMYWGAAFQTSTGAAFGSLTLSIFGIAPGGATITTGTGAANGYNGMIMRVS